MGTRNFHQGDESHIFMIDTSCNCEENGGDCCECSLYQTEYTIEYLDTCLRENENYVSAKDSRMSTMNELRSYPKKVIGEIYISKYWETPNLEISVGLQISMVSGYYSDVNLSYTRILKENGELLDIDETIDVDSTMWDIYNVPNTLNSIRYQKWVDAWIEHNKTRFDKFVEECFIKVGAKRLEVLGGFSDGTAIYKEG